MSDPKLPPEPVLDPVATASPAAPPVPLSPPRVRGQGFFLWLVKYAVYGLIVLTVHAVALLAFFYAQRSRQVPATPTRHAARASAQALTRIYSGDGRLIGEFAAEWRRWASYEEIPPLLVKAFLAVEDRRYFQHKGIDWVGLTRAAWTNVRTGRIVQGGSTISQQLAKTYIGSERTMDRKIKEAILATRIEVTLSKQEILELYLNRIFLGSGAYGVSAAARRYFDKRLDQLTVAEMALIAGLARAPSRYNPFAYPERSLKRRNVVLKRMLEEGYISEPAHRAALVVRTIKDKAGKAIPDLGLRRRPDFYQQETPYFTEHVRQAVLRQFGKEAFDRGGLRVETTVDTGLQALARRHVDELTRWEDKRQGWRGPVAYLGSEDEKQSFRQALAAEYGAADLAPEQRYLGLVERVAPGGAVVRVGTREHTIPLRFLRWGARYYSRTDTNDRFISTAQIVLLPGDVVWVRRGPESGYDPRIPGSDGGPMVHAPNYVPPKGHLHSGLPGRKVPPVTAPQGDGWPGPPYLALEQLPRVQASLFTFDHRTGYVQAMVGGTDFDRSSFNRITQACRQPGSTYKPIYYSLAMDRGMPFSKLIKDKPYSITDPETGRIWYVTDYEYNAELKSRFTKYIQEYKISLEQALVWSKNTASVALFLELGAKAVKDWARRLGFTTEIIADEALALGASCTRTDELARAFALFGSGGRRVEPTYIRRVLDRSGQVLVDHTVPQDPMLSPADRFDRLHARAGVRAEQVIAPRTAHRTGQLLRKMVLDGHADVVRMTQIPAAGKTGTASRTADTWFVGFTSRWLTSAWLGDDHYERPLGRHDASFSTALPLWSRFMFDAARLHPLRELPWLDEKGEPIKNAAVVVPATRPGSHRPDYEPPFKKKGGHTGG